MSIVVERPGALSTFQDTGRRGLQHLGIPVAGAMDERSHRLANLLVGNTEDVATLETTLIGAQLRFEATACIALCGAEVQARCDGQALPLNRPVVIRRGQRLDLGRCARGVRAYLAVHGGFALERTMGSQSTYLRGGFGGWQGRALQRGDEIALVHPLEDAQADALAPALWEHRLYLPAALGQFPRRTVRVVRSAQWREFTPASQQAWLGERWRVGVDSERMGYRLEGPRLERRKPTQMLSEAVTFGTVQVPEGGQPIVLMADHQTTGGYPKIAYVVSVDLPQLAQTAPGGGLRFEAVALETAWALDRQREAQFDAMQRQLQPVRETLARHGGLPCRPHST